MKDSKEKHGIELGRLLKTWTINAANTIVYVLTLGRRVLHEGVFRNGTWMDWARAFSCTPKVYAQPATEKEICDLIRDSAKVRVTGAGHSFNAGVLTNDTLISLDRYNKVDLRENPNKPGYKIATVQAGIRLRDLTRLLWDAGLSISIGGSTDAQSIGGLLATDVHGTGRDHGFVSESILSIRLVDAFGNARTFDRTSDVFHAAIGGAGTCGVIIEVEMLCEPAYQLAKAVKVVPREWAEDHIDELLRENTHLSFYYFAGFARTMEQEHVQGLNKVRMNKWNRTVEPPDAWRKINEIAAEVADVLFSGFVFDIARFLHRSETVARISLQVYALVVNLHQVVYRSSEGFPRKLYFRHDELEYGVPFENYRECLREVRQLLIKIQFPLIIEVRFTPDTSQAFLGPGTGRRSAYLEITPSMSRPSDGMFMKVEEIILRHGGQAHLGKKSYIDRPMFEHMYARTIQQFQTVRKAQDPNGKFLNDFTGRLFT
jgi:FAD/FMN-containing dehydrogenase